MWLSFEKTKEIFWEQKAIEMFNQAWVQIKRKSTTEEKEYRKLSESAHGKILHKFLQERWINHSHIGNEAWQWWSKNIIIMMSKKKAQWVSKWFPDYFIYIPTLQYHIQLCIELKKARWINWWLNWSEISEEQLQWQRTLSNTIWTFYHFAHWSDEAISIVQNYIERFKNKTMMAALTEWADFTNNFLENEKM